MNVGQAPRVAVDKCLRLVRLPVDVAISLLPGDGNGVRTMARLAVDRADATLRVVAGALLRDAGLAQEPRGWPDAGAAQEPRGRPDPGPAQEPRGRPDPPPAQEPQGWPEAGPAQEPQGRPDPAPAQDRHGQDQDAEPPSEDEVAARAYELYERGMPGSPDEHWLAAEREMMSARD